MPLSKRCYFLLCSISMLAMEAKAKLVNYIPQVRGSHQWFSQSKITRHTEFLVRLEYTRTASSNTNNASVSGFTTMILSFDPPTPNQPNARLSISHGDVKASWRGTYVLAIFLVYYILPVKLAVKIQQRRISSKCILRGFFFFINSKDQSSFYIT
jgi:hypothetical protein